MSKSIEAIKAELAKKRNKIHATKKEIETILKAANTGNWDDARQTKLYINHGGEYCTLLEIL